MNAESPFKDLDTLRHEMKVMQNDLLTLHENIQFLTSSMTLLMRLETSRQDEIAKSKKVD